MARPSKFDGINKREVRILVNRGWKDEELAMFFGVTQQTWDNYKKAYKGFFGSLKKWKQDADEQVEKSLYEKACGYETIETKVFQYGGETVIQRSIKQIAPDTTACIFWLKNRQPDKWRRSERENAAEIQPLVIKIGTDEIV